MAALVQAFPTQQSAAAVSLLQTRPQSASGPLQSTSQIQPHVIMQQRSMTSYGPPTGSNSSAFRNYSGTTPVAPYAFTSTPGLTNSHTKQPQQVWTDTKNAAVRPIALEETRLRYPVSDASSSSSVSSEPPTRYHHSHQQQLQQFTRTNPNTSARPLSVAALPGSMTVPTTPNSPRPSPDRYRRGKKGDGNVSANPTIPQPSGSAAPSASGMATLGMQPTLTGTHGRANTAAATSAATTAAILPITTYAGQQLRRLSVDDIHTHRSPNGPTRHQIQHRRASVGAFSPGSLTMFPHKNGQVPDLNAIQFPNFSPQAANHRAHAPQGSASGVVARRGSNDSSASVNSTSSHSSHPNTIPNNNNKNTIHNNNNNNNNNNNAPTASCPPIMNPAGPHEINLAHVPPRDSSQVKRVMAPSPLSKPLNMNSASDAEPPLSSNGTSEPIPSAAAERLQALSADPRRGLKNRLRRAFSFGSAAELRKAAAGNSGDTAERIRQRQERFREEQEAEQSRVALQQEAAGLGEGIYSNGQGHFFSGSTDNLSVSSTASSASIMIRKMGKGMKRSTRSLVGLFRPRSVIGVEAASGPMNPEPTAAQVTMVHVEADKGKTNAVSSGDKDVGVVLVKGPGPLNSAPVQPVSTTNGIVSETLSRHGGSFVGGDTERAELLAAVRKGILKRQGSSSPIIKPADNAAPYVPQTTSPEASSQSPVKHQRGDSLTLEGEDYFMKLPKFAGKSAQSAPPSPSGGRGSVTFSPRITFHDTWPSGEYDRRGDVATCNRLTPALAQQIKEELNTFKMEMDVHEESKIYTHFF